jgi:hypothetical protein
MKTSVEGKAVLTVDGLLSHMQDMKVRYFPEKSKKVKCY